MTKRSKLNLFLGSVLVLLSACGRYQQSNNAMVTPTALPSATPLPTGIVPDTPGHTDPIDEVANTWTTGATTIFRPVSDEVFNRWVSLHPVQPKDVLINVDLKKASNKSTYYGQVRIRYKSGGQTYQATLKVANTTYDNKDFYMYNYWFNYQGKSVFSGFFDDSVGAIVLVINKVVDLGDGAGATDVGGEVWFKNYGASWAGYYEGSGWSVVMPCWFRSIGPYNCQSASVMTKSSLYPDMGYEKLGDFTNLNKAKAFGN